MFDCYFTNYHSNAYLFRCQIAVHQECYGARAVQDLTTWLCRACESPQRKRECCLCPVKGIVTIAICSPQYSLLFCCRCSIVSSTIFFFKWSHCCWCFSDTLYHAKIKTYYLSFNYWCFKLQLSCLLCCFRLMTCIPFFLYQGGALKPTDIDGLWVHVTCAWFQPKVSFPVEETMEPAMGILSIPSEYFKKVEIFYWLKWYSLLCHKANHTVWYFDFHNCFQDVNFTSFLFKISLNLC